jgi:hypothetical protein
MSKDKHKKRDRAYAFIRQLRSGGRGYHVGEAKFHLSGRRSKIIQYCLEKGLATLKRVRVSPRTRRNEFNAE